MNLVRVLNNALPDIPARDVSDRPPRLDPETSFKEHIEDGRPVIRIYVPSAKAMYGLPVPQWKLAQLFDGTRTYEEIARDYSRENGAEYDVASVREFAGDLESIDFWYRTTKEKNILLLQQSVAERKKKLEQQSRSKWADLSDVTFPAFNPDNFLTWLYGKTKFFYTTWFTVVTLIAFAITAGIMIANWQQIGHDTLEFYDFTKKTWFDVFLLYTLGMVVVAVHEFAHAHACKHCGGHVRSMGLALVYLTPAFYTDTTEGAVLGTRFQRLVIYVAGMWSELILCAIATPIWWGTAPGTLVHDGAYFIMMMTGLMSLVLNWNPLMKLDGYFMLCEITKIANIKEDSTAFVSAWIKKHIWRLPVEVPYVPKRRRIGFAIYSALSGIYSYGILYIIARFVGNFVRNFSPEWGFIPEIGVALLIFKSRIRLLVNFMKFVYLDKKDRIRAWFTVKRSLAIAGTVAVLACLPVWHESVVGRFLLEPIHSAVVRARMPGTIDKIYVKEGQKVSAGEDLAQLTSMPMKSRYDDAKYRLVQAADRMNLAGMHYKEYGTAVKEHEKAASDMKQVAEMNATLDLRSPIAGEVTTARLGDRVGEYLDEGSELLEVADMSRLRAKVYVSEFDMYRIKPNAAARVEVKGLMGKQDAAITGFGTQSVKMDERLADEKEASATNPTHYYAVNLEVENASGRLRPGMEGTARIYGQWRSLAGMGAEWFRNFWGRKFW